MSEKKTDQRERNARQLRKPLVHEAFGYQRESGGTDGKPAQHQQGYAGQESGSPEDIGDEADEEEQTKSQWNRHRRILVLPQAVNRSYSLTTECTIGE